MEEIGFGGLLNIPCTNLVYSCTLWIARHFSPLLSQVEFEDGRKLLVTDDEVAVTLGLPESRIALIEEDMVAGQEGVTG